MTAIFTVVLVVVLSLLTTRVAATALTLTGLSRESGRFQARSALTGTGFTTSESEAVMNHPVRRRIILALMLVGRAGIVTVMASLTVSFAGADGAREATNRIVVLGASLGLLLVLAHSRQFDRLVERLIERALRRYTDVDARDYAGLLHLADDYAVVELMLGEDSWMANRSLGDLRLRDEGIVVLGIERSNGTYDGAPGPGTTAHAHDTLVLYGCGEHVHEVAARRSAQQQLVQ